MGQLIKYGMKCFKRSNLFQSGENEVPYWEQTYPLPFGTFESIISLFTFGGICDCSLDGNGILVVFGWWFGIRIGYP